VFREPGSLRFEGLNTKRSGGIQARLSPLVLTRLRSGFSNNRANFDERAKKQPVFGMLCRKGYVWAEIVPNVETDTLMPLIRKKVQSGSVLTSIVI